MATSEQSGAMAERRWKKGLRRRHRKEKKQKKDQQTPSLQKYVSPVLSLFVQKVGRMRAQKLAAKTFIAPRVFSLSQNPSECLEYLSAIVNYAREARRPRIILDQRRIEYLGLGADSVLGVVLSELKQELRHVYGTYIKGFKPRARDIQRIMEEVGSVRTLFMDSEEDIRVSFQSRAQVFRHRHRPSDDATVSRHYDPAADVISGFADHLDAFLGEMGRKLSVDGRDGLCHYVGEVLDNAREHAGLGEWAIVGFFDPDAELPTYRCAIFSFGNTISATFEALAEDAYPRMIVEPYLKAHRGGNLFTETWRESDLLTLIALQGDVSSKSLDESSDRGQGTVELINFFQSVSDECEIRKKISEGIISLVPTGTGAEMNIVSGSTLIRFDGTYSMSFREELNRSVIAFNTTNDLSLKPDSAYVRSLKGLGFPGVLITVVLPLTSTFFEELGDAH